MRWVGAEADTAAVMDTAYVSPVMVGDHIVVVMGEKNFRDGGGSSSPLC